MAKHSDSQQEAVVKDGSPDVASSKPDRGKSDTKQGSTFLTENEALQRVVPSLRKSRQLVEVNKLRTVPSWMNNLKRWLVREERGSFDEHRSPFLKHLSFEQVANLVMDVIKKNGVKTKHYYASVPNFANVLENVEDHQSHKIAPRGCFPPWHVWGDPKVEEVFSDKVVPKGFDKAAFAKALRDLTQLSPSRFIKWDSNGWKDGLKTASAGSANQNSLDTSTNSCFPNCVRGWFHAIWDRTVSLAQRAVQMFITSDARYIWKVAEKAKTVDEIVSILERYYTAIANQRTNVGSDYKKTKENTYRGKLMSKLRVVIAMPKIDTVIGKWFANRLLAFVKRIVNPDGTHPFCALTTPEEIVKNMQVCLETAHKHKLIPVGTDFSGFDTSIAPWYAMAVAQAIVPWMDDRSARLWLALITCEFYRTDCITPTNYYPKGPSKMKSGSIFTNLMDSLINFVSQRYGLYAGYYKSILCQFVQGDDAILLGEGITPESFEKCVAEQGFEGNADKQYYEEGSVSFCQLLHVRGYPGGIYPVARAMASVVSTEDDVQMDRDDHTNFKYVETFRTLNRLNNACFNPNWVDIVNIIAKDDELHLGKDLPPQQLARLAGNYAKRFEVESKTLKPWKSQGSKLGFNALPINRVLRGSLPPPPGIKLFEWVYQTSYASVGLYTPNEVDLGMLGAYKPTDRKSVV